MVENQPLFYYTVLLSALACLAMPFLRSGNRSVLAFLIILLNAILTSLLAVRCFLGQVVHIKVLHGSVFNDIVISIDPLSAWFILIVNLTCLTGALYGIHYMKAYAAQSVNLTLHWCSFIIFHCSMLWVCSLQNSLAFLVAWEIMSISSFLLVIFDHSHVSNVRAGINYLVQMHIGVTFLAVGFIMVALKTRDYDFKAIQAFFLEGNSHLLFFLFFIGFGLKAGFVPLHSWLPHAHPAAPSHVSGVMSGVIVKMGIYGILRVLTYLNTNLLGIGAIVLAMSIITAIYGILSGAIHRDIKRILAFCTIENIGIIGMGIGIGIIGRGIGSMTLMSIGFSAALLHTLNHSLYKSLLFFVSGSIYQQTHSRNMEHLGGLMKKMPWSGFFFLSGSCAISGLPPFNGFISKFLLMTGFVEGIQTENLHYGFVMIICMISLALAGGLSLLTFSKSFSVVFLGSARTTHSGHAHEIPWNGLFPLGIILACMLLIGFYPSIVFVPVQQVMPIMDSRMGLSNGLDQLTQTLSFVGVTSLVFVMLFLVLFLLRSRIVRQKTVVYLATWGCGYIAPNARMQYTGKSFSKTLAKLFSFLTQEQKKYTEIENSVVFPAQRAYQSSYLEFFEKQFINKVINLLLKLLSYFSFVHNGRVQMYMLYGVFFILILFIATIFNLI